MRSLLCNATNSQSPTHFSPRSLPITPLLTLIVLAIQAFLACPLFNKSNFGKDEVKFSLVRVRSLCHINKGKGDGNFLPIELPLS